MTIKDIAGLVPTMMGVTMVSDNLKVVNSKKKMKTKDVVNMGVKNIVGASMLKSTAGIIGGL